MEKNKSVVEETLLRIKAVEEAISENAKGILASTMREEISELVKESLKGKKNLHEQEEAPEEGEPMVDDETEDEFEDESEFDVEDDESEEGVGEPEMSQPDMEDDNEDELPPLDMTQASPEEVLRVFKAMGDQDGVIVKKQDDGDIHLVDNNNDTEYLITFGGGSEPTEQMSVMENDNYHEGFKDYLMNNMKDESEMMEEDDFEIEFEDSEEDFTDEFYESMDMDMDDMGMGMDDMPSMMSRRHSEMDEDEQVYEMNQEDLESVLESFKYSKKPNMDGGFDKKMKEAPKRGGKGGDAKKAAKYPTKELKHGVTETDMDDEEFDQWEEETYEDVMAYEDMDMGTETTEASRTLGNGKKWGRKGLPKPKAAPRHLEVESVKAEVNMLREKNEEYKKALDFFRNKLNEVAMFNSNLAYSTRLFTEHSTTKQEKINILRRFDNVESLKESKNLYKSIKNELGGETTHNVVKESINERVIKTPQTGSATNLIETKTYENPQFMRMKDLMTKIK